MSDYIAARRKFLTLSAAGIVSPVLASEGAYAASPTASPRERFDVTAYGAKGDGKTVDSPAIDKAIGAASSAGGGTVLFPPGTYLCFSIHLKSNVTLSVGPGATVVAAESSSSGDASGYDPPEPNQWDKYQDFGHSHWHNSLIWGEDLHDIAILGPGLIWGKGLNRGSGDKALAAGVGNKAISLKNCRNVRLRDLSILHGGHFAILATGVDNLTIDNLLIDTNRDAIDVDCCRNVRISNCSVNSPWDDGICLKSSYGLGYARSTDHVTIANCYVTGGFEEGTLLDATYKRIGPNYKAPRNGRIKFGTESNGGFRNIAVTNCVVEDCRGIALESVDGAILEDVAISNITMRDITDVPFFLRLGSRMRGPENTPIGELRRVLISNVVVSNANSRQAAIITGIPGHYISDLRFSNIYILHQGGGSPQDSTIQPPEIETAYPDPNRFGPMPAHGFFIRHARAIEMRDVTVTSMKEDARPAFMLEDVEDVDFTHIKLPRGDAGKWMLKNVKDFTLAQSKPQPDTYLENVTEKTL